jgi:hypothetical protein
LSRISAVARVADVERVGCFDLLNVGLALKIGRRPELVQVYDAHCASQLDGISDSFDVKQVHQCFRLRGSRYLDEQPIGGRPPQHVDQRSAQCELRTTADAAGDLADCDSSSRSVEPLAQVNMPEIIDEYNPVLFWRAEGEQTLDESRFARSGGPGDEMGGRAPHALHKTVEMRPL